VNRALAFCGARAETTKLSEELSSRFPEATLTRRVQLPVSSAALAVHSGDSERVLALLAPVQPYDRARGADFWPAFLRGQAYLMSKRGAEAAREFAAILSHRGAAPDSVLFPLAHLGAARAANLAGDAATAKTEYDAFLTMWRDADADLPPLRDARAERTRLP
jgi:eukaryotic-like serine/threonine-protein kinase